MIKNYAEKFEQAEQARKELESLIQEKTGYTCAAYVSHYPHQAEPTYKIFVPSFKGFMDVCKLFTDKPFYQEEIARSPTTKKPVKDLSCSLNIDGSKLVIYTTVSMQDYKKWMELKNA